MWGHMSRLSPTRTLPLPPPPLPGTGPCWALFLDVDGTLVDFHNDPDMVHVGSALKTTLAGLHDALGGALALVSGRRLYDLDRLFGPPIIAAAGLHGLQRRRDDGSEDDRQPEPDVVERLHEAVTAWSRTLPRLRIEDKGTCVAVHYREVPGQKRAALEGARRIARTLPGYEIQTGNHIVEIKPSGIDKGDAVESFMAEMPFRGRRPVYVGDDLTDEHAFTTVNAHDGISVRVGSREPSQARYTLRDPDAVEAWLEGVLMHL